MRRRAQRIGLVAVVLAGGVACDGNGPVLPGEPSGVPTAGAPAASPSPPTELAAGTLAIEAFSVVEYRYPGYPGWYYAPQVRVANPAGGGAVSVTRAEFAIPGLPVPPPACTHQRVESGESHDLVGEVYGDYELSIDNPGARATGGEAAVTIVFVDGKGATASVTARGPVVSGGLPTTYSGGTGGWRPCP